MGVLRAKVIVYLVAAFGCGTAGALIYLDLLRIQPRAAFSTSWTAFIIFIVVIGGIGTIDGPIIGTAVFFMTRELLADYGTWYLVALGSIAVVVMLVAPGGLWSLVQRRFDLRFFPSSDGCGHRRRLPHDAASVSLNALYSADGRRLMSQVAGQEQAGGGAVARPMTGDEYLESLRDGREVWIYGEKVQDVTTHPAFRNGARSIARLYDGLHDPELRDVLTAPTDTGSGGYTHPFFKAPMSAEDLVAGRDAIAAWQRMTYGWMGRSPDYKAAFLATYGPNASYYTPFEENARRWYRDSQEHVYFMNHTLVNPPVDRNREIHEVSDIFVHKVGETDEGVIVRGAKMVATGSAFSNYNFVSYHGNVPIRREEFALSFFAPMDAPGVKLICRPSYEFTAAATGSPFDYPLSSRFDENDAVLMFEDALIPWENFLIDGNLEIASTYHLTGFIWRAMLQGCTRLAVKLDFLAGLFVKTLEATGTIEFRGIQASIGEILAWRNTFWALTDAMCHNPVPSANGSVLPSIEAASAYRILSNIAMPKITEIIQNQVAGAMIVQPSNAADWKQPELRPLLDQFYRGSGGYEAIDKIKLIKLLWDAVGSEFGGRHLLYERTYSGSHELTRLECFWMAQGDGTVDRMKGFAEQCMAEYDIDGWTVPDLINPDDVSVFKKR